MSPLSDLPPPRTKRRLTFVLRLWAHGHEQPVWIGEVQDISTGETAPVQGLEALFNLLKQKADQALETKQQIEPTKDYTHTKG
jgi:hypothetical protein